MDYNAHVDGFLAGKEGQDGETTCQCFKALLVFVSTLIRALLVVFLSGKLLILEGAVPVTSN